MIFEYIIGLVILFVMGWIVWESSVVLSERKARFKAGTHDYYDNPIKKDNNETVS
jgi:hypothetical protein